MPKKWKEAWKVWGNVFDQYTMRNLFKLQCQGYFADLQSPVSVGKEANIFTAVKEDGSSVIVKIYRLQTCDFNKMYDYIKLDNRYEHLKKQRRKVIFSWTQREFRNLMKAREVGIRVPTPITFLDNILVLEFIGDEYVAPKMKDALPRSKKALQAFFDKIIEYMRMYWKAGFVHGDLSKFNILNYHDVPIFIDFSQATTTQSMHARELLLRDINNIVNFAQKQGLKMDKDEILKNILKK